MKSNLPALLEAHRQRYGLTYYQLGKLVDMEQGQVHKFIRNKDAMLLNIATIEKIAKIIPLDYGDLLTEDKGETS